MILITGGTGTIGSEVVKQLTTTDARVRILVRDSKKVPLKTNPNIEFVIGDLNNPPTLDAALQGIENAFLLTANSQRQVEQERNFIDAVKRTKTPRMVKLSAFKTGVDSPYLFAKWHGLAEQYLEESGVPHTILHPNFFMQNLSWFAPTIIAENKFYLPSGDGVISMVDARDVAAVAVAVLSTTGHEGKSYIITGPEALSLGEVAEKLSKAIGKSVTYVKVTPDDFKHLIQLGQPEWYANALTESYEPMSANNNSLLTNVVAEVGKKRPITFDEFVQDYTSAFKGN